jgi:carbamoyltransferase
MQTKLNLKIKYRESFRPFAPSVLVNEVEEYFNIKSESPYMLLVRPLQSSRRIKLKDDYNELPLMKKLRTVRSDIPAVTHVDFSGRIQTVDGMYNPTYYKLIQKFKSITGYGLIVNTSFNVRGEPIVCTPEDAYRCFMRTEMDYLVINNFILTKTKQPDWEKTDDWKTEFVLD